MHEELVRLTGDIQSGGLAKHLFEALHNAGFLEDEIYEQMRDSKHRAFADASVREPSHAGTAYPENAAD